MDYLLVRGRAGALAILAAAALTTAAPAFAADPPKREWPTHLRHGYVDMRYGQLHYAIAEPAGGSTKEPIVLLHQSPNSSVEYDALTAELGKDRLVIAIDTPGHGGSDGPMTQPTIEDYAAAVAEGLTNLGFGANKPVAIFGNHTGSRIGTELALTHPEMISHVMLGLSPYALIDDKLSAKLLTEVHHPTSGADLFATFCPSVPRRISQTDMTAMADPVWAKIAVESLRGITRQEYGHAAAYEYGPRFKTRLLGLTQPVLLLVIDDPIDASVYQSDKTAADMSNTLKPQLTKAKRVEIFNNGFHNDVFFGRPAEIAAGFGAFVDKN
ncbi:alpha/beta fold hydrolase [Phenylobacterium immobile]|uniref:alpha/beta fold hydrolase n=1 Tax=Phenylobacterium immobile TaxID=21 RepID=UPI000A41F535|nr:alpha/beta hydrolase [Phenylobacterium immobile]